MIFFVARLRAAVLRAGDEALLVVFFFAFATGAREALPVAFFAALRAVLPATRVPVAFSASSREAVVFLAVVFAAVFFVAVFFAAVFFATLPAVAFFTAFLAAVPAAFGVPLEVVAAVLRTAFFVVFFTALRAAFLPWGLRTALRAVAMRCSWDGTWRRNSTAHLQRR